MSIAVRTAPLSGAPVLLQHSIAQEEGDYACPVPEGQPRDHDVLS